MLRVLSMYNNISRLPPALILFVSVAIVTTSNAKSSEALDFGETSVAASRLTEKLEHSLQYKNRNCSISNNNNNNLTSQILSRRKRYLAFPLGSSFSCAVCLTTGVVGNPNYQYLSMGLNWGFAYDLPNATWVLDHVHALGRKKGEKDVEVVEEPTIKRRHRRDLYHKVETIMNNIPLPLLDYRLIAINALIYDLIASEIVNVNAHIVIAATDMTEFDKSATMRTTCTTTKILRLTHERQREALKSPTTRRSTTMSNDDKAELAFFGQKSRHTSDHIVLGDNNSLSDRNIGFTLLANGKGIGLPITPQTPATPTSDDVVVSIIAPRTFDMMSDDSSRFANSFNVIPTINERVDNFRNDKKQIASTTMTGVVTAARTAAAVTAKSEVRVDSEQPAIKVRVITAIKSAATQFTTSALQPSVLISASTIPARTRRVSTHAAQPVTSATPAQTTKAATISKATITMSKLLTTTTAAVTAKTTTMETRAMPTLHGHDLLSSTNWMPNCRVTPECACVEQCHGTTNSNIRTTTTDLAFVESSRAIKTAAAAALTTSSPSSPSSPSSSIPTTPELTAKVEATTATAMATPTTEAKASQQSWSTAHVTKSGSTKLSPSNNNSAAFNANSNKKKLATATSTTKAAQTLSERNAACPTPSAMPCSTTVTTNLTTIATTTAKSEPSKSTAALHLHWQRILSRQKRYLAFPEGSSFSVSLCITVGIIGNPRYNYMSYGLNWGVSYDLPNATWVLNQLHGLSRRPMPEAVLHRRSKRALYERIGEAVDNMGYNGRECVLRALCESRQYFARNKTGMIGEMLRVVFSLPKQRLFTRELRENSEILAYDHAYRKARTIDCATHYDCSFSLLELAFGKYARPPIDYYNKFGM